MKVLLVGDSWAHSHLVGAISRQCGCPVSVSRNPGKTSLEISRAVRIQPGFDFVVVVAGINDVVRHVGAEAYTRGMLAIAQNAATAGATPMLMELPRLGPVKAPTVPQGVKRWLLRMWNDGGSVDPTNYYRDTLRCAWDGIEIPFPQMSPRCWSDPMHLNDIGRTLLARAISPRLAVHHPLVVHGESTALVNFDDRETVVPCVQRSVSRMQVAQTAGAPS